MGGIHLFDTVTNHMARAAINAVAAWYRAVLRESEEATEEMKVDVGKNDAVSQLPFSPEALRLLRRVQAS